jgi:hypothetical protein
MAKFKTQEVSLMRSTVQQNEGEKREMVGREFCQPVLDNTLTVADISGIAHNRMEQTMSRRGTDLIRINASPLEN